MKSLGYHYIWDVYNCDYESIHQVKPVQMLMANLIESSNLTKIGESFNQFAPHGVTGIYLLEESHLSIHTWPEESFAAIDLFSCMSLDNLVEIEQLIRKHLGIVRLDFKMVERGNFDSTF